jgi:hypothetical protein
VRRYIPLFFAAAGCTVVKPVTCGVVHPIRSVGTLFEESTAEPDEVDDTPTFVGVCEFPLVLPVYFAYKAVVGVIGGLGTGIVSDFNVVSGHASWDRTLANLTRPNKTNAVR